MGRKFCQCQHGVNILSRPAHAASEAVLAAALGGQAILVGGLATFGLRRSAGCAFVRTAIFSFLQLVCAVLLSGKPACTNFEPVCIAVARTAIAR